MKNGSNNPPEAPPALPRTEIDDAPDGSIDAVFTVPFVHRIRFTRDVFAPENDTLAELLAAGDRHTRRAVAFIDDGVARAWPDLGERVKAYLKTHGVRLVLDPQIVPGGECAKQDRNVTDEVTRVVQAAGICRHSYVFAIGGGAVLDAVGFGAATAHRGVRLIRFPTTTLAQDDAGIGVKNGINAYDTKNFLGSFDVPFGVINDEDFLRTLSDRDWRAGMSEAVKVALLKDEDFFDEIEQAAPLLAVRDADAARPIIQRCAELHLEHIVRGGDPFERLGARPLDFGHWAGHRIEELSRYSIRHGDAVAIGLALDVTYSHVIGRLDEEATERILGCLETIGFELSHPHLEDGDRLLAGLDEFREHLGGQLTITLLDEISEPFDAHEIDRDRMKEAMRRLMQRGN